MFTSVHARSGTDARTRHAARDDAAVVRLPRPRPVTLRAVVGAGVALAGALGVAGCGSDPPSPVERLAQARQAQAEEAADRAGLRPDAREVLVLAAGSVAEEFSVTYELEDGTRAVLIQSPPYRRIDLLSGTSADPLIRSIIVNRDGTFSCVQQDGDWTCDQAKRAGADDELGPFSASAVQDAVTALAGAKDRYDLDVERRRIAGQEARCLVATPKAGATPAEGEVPGVLCVSAQGAPLLVKGSGPSLTAVSYATTAPASALRPPA